MGESTSATCSAAVGGGDQYLVFKVVVPPGKPDDRTRELVEEFAKRNPQDARANVPWA